MKKTQSKIKTEWDLAKHFYKGVKDPRFTKDIENIKRAYVRFEKKYKGRTDYLTSAPKLLQALKDSEQLMTTANERPLLYLHYRTDMNSGDTEAEALSTKISRELTEYGNRLIFFGLSLRKIPKAKQKEFLSDKRLSRYHRELADAFRFAPYDLTEPEEKILNLTAQTRVSLWRQGVEKLQNKQVIDFAGKKIPLAGAINMIPELPTKKRHDLHKKVFTRLRDMSDFAESELNALYTGKYIQDKLRGFKTPYESPLLGHEIDEKTLQNLLSVVGKYQKLSHRFYAIKQKLLGVSYLTYADRGASVGKIKKKFSFNKNFTTLKEVLTDADPRLAHMLETMAENAQIDVYPRKGKAGGAYCSSSFKNPTLILLNDTGSFRAGTTLAHEMGHAIHSELSKVQPPMYQGYSTAVAETASTFFERMFFEHVVRDFSEKEKLIALHDSVGDSVSTIFRQISCFNFEQDLHIAVREKGFVQKEEIAVLMNKRMQEYIGPTVKLTEDDGYSFVSWSHIRRFSYVYTYAYGELLSMSLYGRFCSGALSIKDIVKFFSLGDSMSPHELFKTIGIDTHKPDAFLIGMKGLEQKVKELEKLTKKK